MLEACKTVMKALSKAAASAGASIFASRRRTENRNWLRRDTGKDIDDKLNVPIMLMRSLMQAGKPDNVTITFVTREGQEITGSETVNPAMAMPIGPCLAGMSEYPGLRCRIFDIPAVVPNTDELAQRVAADLAGPAPSIVTAYRGNSRWARGFQPIPPAVHRRIARGSLRRQGVYLITGGLGDLGLAISRHLARSLQSKRRS